MNNRMEVLRLPGEVLTRILQHVDPKQRLTISALLSTRFRDAAIAATDTIQLETKSLAKTESLAAWLHNHGADITCLKLSSAQGFQLHELPCVHLKTLELQDATMSLSVPGPLSSCSDLHSLTFKNCTIPAVSAMPMASSNQFAGLAKLVNLSHLSLKWDPPGRHPTIMLQGSVLSGLLQLTSLVLAHPAVVSGFSNLCALTALQELEVCLSVDTTSAELAEVHQLQNLTKLYLHCGGAAALNITPQDTPGISQLPKLMKLCLTHCVKCDPLLLQPLAQLEELEVQYVTLSGGSAGASALLAVLSELSSLTLLDLRSSLYPGPVNPAAYTALSALPSLAAIWLDHCILPAGMWQYLQGAECVMSRLTTVSLTGAKLVEDDLEEGVAPANPWLELPSLAACCPHVERLMLTGALGGELYLNALTQLRFLSELYIAPTCNMDLEAVARLRKLRVLHLDSLGVDVTDEGLLYLTASTALARLELPAVLGGVAAKLSTELVASLTQTLQQDAGRPCLCSNNAQVPDVWQQLVSTCMASSSCRPVLLRQLQDLETERTQAAARLATVQQHDDNTGQNCQCLHCRTWKKPVQRRESRLMQRETWVSSAQPRMAKTEAILNAWSQHLDKTDTNLAPKAAALANRDQKASALKAQLSARAAELVGKAARLAAAHEQLAAREAAVACREQQLRLHEQRVVTRLITWEPQLRSRDWHLSGRAADVAAREQQAAHHEARLASWQAQLQVQEQNVARAAAAGTRYGVRMG